MPTSEPPSRHSSGPDVLVAYATKMGGTAGIACTIAEELRARGLIVDVKPAADVGDVGRYRVVVLGSALYTRRWRPEAVRFLSRHADQLRSRKVLLFQSGPCGQDAVDPDQPEPARVRRLREAIEADPPITFGGLLDPATARGFVARHMARGELAGDFRDLDRVRAWASGFAADINGPAAGAADRLGARDGPPPATHRATVGAFAVGEVTAVPRTYRLGPSRRALNRVMTVLLGWGIGPASSYLLTTTGRSTGMRRTTPVTLVETGGRRWLVAPYGRVGWVHNVRATPEVSLRRGRMTTVLSVHEVDAETAGPVLRRYVAQVPVTAPFFSAEAGDPVEAFVTEAFRHPVFALGE